MKTDKLLLVAAAFVTTFTLLLIFGPRQDTPIAQAPPQIQPWPQQPPIEQPPAQPDTPNISVKIPKYLPYDQMVQQLKTWNQEAPELTEVGTYGKSSRGKDLYYIRVTNKRLTNKKPNILITACIHGNEPLSASTVLGYIGTMLATYRQDDHVTKLIDERDIYFVPIVSPDSHPNSRHVDGVDPNRDFPSLSNPNKRSVPPVQALRDFFLQHKFKAVISGHTWGRVYLIPYGDTDTKNENWEDYQRIMGKMSNLSGYKIMRAFDMYQGNGLAIPPPQYGPIQVSEWAMRPIYGTEVDWYYRHGAMSIVCEYGHHQRIPSDQDTQVEFDKTYRATLIFIDEMPIIR